MYVCGLVWCESLTVLFVVQSPFNCGNVIFQMEMLNVNRIDMNLQCALFMFPLLTF